MINQAMFPPSKDKLNEFTSEVKKRCLKNGLCPVKLRNETWIDVYFQNGNEDETCFHSKEWDLVWRPDGSSFTCNLFDIVELEER